MDTSAPEGRRYGEPDWEFRPVEQRNYGGTVLFADPSLFGRDPRDFPEYTEKSYEEWKLEGQIERSDIYLSEEWQLTFSAAV